LEAPYAERPTLPARPDTDVMLTIEPTRRVFMRRAAACATRKLPMTLIS
jgi:hypothetical protein